MDRRAEFKVIVKIAERAIEMSKNSGIEYERIDAIMDIDYAHKEVPLRLEELLASDDVNFAHDVFGIRRHLNRQTLKIENCFLPRYAV